MDGKHDLREEQQIVMMISDIAMDVFIAESTLLRIAKLKQGSYEVDTQIPMQILKLFLHEAQHRINQNAQDALASFATGDELSIMLKGVKRFTKYPLVNVKELRNEIARVTIAANEYPL